MPWKTQKEIRRISVIPVSLCRGLSNVVFYRTALKMRRRSVAARPRTPVPRSNRLLGSGVVVTLVTTRVSGEDSREKKVVVPAASPVIFTKPVSSKTEVVVIPLNVLSGPSFSVGSVL